MDPSSSEELLGVIIGCRATVGLAHAELLRALVRGDLSEIWREWGARDMAHFVSMCLGISHWKASRFLHAAQALPRLPSIARALETGHLSIDKVIELARFATPQTDEQLCRWATGVSPARVRERADLEVRRDAEEAAETEDARSVRWWHEASGMRLELSAGFPTADGAVVTAGIDRWVEQHPPAHGDGSNLEARRADALVAIVAASLATGQPESERSTVVLHASVEALASTDRTCELEGGGLVHAETARRLLCTSKLQMLVEDRGGDVLAASTARRNPPEWMVRQLRNRDRECRYPGCGTRRWVQAHHIRWVSLGGRTELANLVLLCHLHHKLVHEHRWRIARSAEGDVEWFRPDGARHPAGADPPAIGAVA